MLEKRGDARKACFRGYDPSAALKNVRVADKAAALNDPDVQAAGRLLMRHSEMTEDFSSRQSGTEPLIRVMVEAETPRDLREVCGSGDRCIEEKGHVTES